MTTLDKMTERDWAINNLRRMLSVDGRIYAKWNHTSESGSSHAITLLIPILDERSNRMEILDISSLAAKALGCSLHPKGGVWRRGGGMDMSFEVVYELGRVLDLKLTRERM
jgi:hypothetical protein